MKAPMTVLLLISTACLLSACADSSAKLSNGPPSANARANDAPVQPDNSGVNTRDMKSDTTTAGDQSEAPADREMTQRIRKAVVADDSLSMVAHNVKIITIDTRVTLRGPVNSDNEKMKIDRLAKEIAGATKVDNQLEVKH